MGTPSRRARGFTLVELMVVLAIVGILSTLAAVGMARFRPRASLSSSAAQLTALFNAARQNSLATGHDTVVMVFPQYQNPAGGVGRVVLYEDAAHSFFSTTANPNFSGFSPSDPTTTWSRGEILETLDLPLNVTVGLGGVAAPALAAPYDLITASACSFCDSSGDGRGAVVFDSRGRALFYTASGAALAAWGGTLALQGPTSIAGYRMVIITTATGSVRTINNG